MSVRPKIMKLARMIGGLPGMLNKLDENSPEYYCLDCVVTDEMAEARKCKRAEQQGKNYSLDFHCFSFIFYHNT